METSAGIRAGHRAFWRGTPKVYDAGSSPRAGNARRVLAAAWPGEPLTAGDLMEATGLTRATVLSVCKDLVSAGWLGELADARAAGDYEKGRPARRYAFRPDCRYAVGVDAGAHSLTAAVVNLAGTELARIRRASDPEASGLDRRAALESLVLDVLEQAGVAPEAVAAVVVGVPAPVDASGRSPQDRLDNFWNRMNPEFITVFGDRDWDVVVDNDANLAALAESATGMDAGVRGFATLLSGERFGAGVVIDGQLMRGKRGAVGELRVLDLVVGVDSADGLAHQARAELRNAAAAGRLVGMLAACPDMEPDAKHVFAAAELGDPVALEIVDVLARRLAPVAMLLSGMLDLERIIVAGAIAPAVGPVLKRTRELMGRDSTLSWAELVASEHGDGVVLAGALHSAIALVREGALTPSPPPEVDITGM